MSDHDAHPLPTMSGPATFAIRVSGRLTAQDSERLGGLALEYSSTADGEPITTLRGRLPDQAALLGVLNALYSWQVPVLSVEALDA
jgi:hypothetical protein